MTTQTTVEKAVLLGAFIVRRLAESHKLSDGTPNMQLRVTRVPSTGKPVTLLNNHRIDELFDFRKAVRNRRSLRFLCNQAIHSYILGGYTNRAATRVVGIYLASDFERNTALYAVPLVEFERAFRRAARDYPAAIACSLDEKLGDYRVTTDARKALLLARRG